MHVQSTSIKPTVKPAKAPEEGKQPSTAQDMLEVQKKSDQDQEKMALASNLQKKGHDTLMMIIANIR